MIGYVTLGTNDLERASEFYDALLAELGAKRIGGDDRMRMWGKSMREPVLAICTPYDGKTASVGNGVMVALDAGSREAVDRIYDKAIELGAADEGPAGPRGDGSFYGGYFRDPDGNKLVAYLMGR
jgi:catechol 2,3-dioxygenase-like lactoylglutathione lyase family enzyme